MRDMIQTPSLNRLRQTYLDPSINLIFGQMRDEIDRNRKAREEAQNELQAWQFTPDRFVPIRSTWIVVHPRFSSVKLEKCSWQDVKSYWTKTNNWEN